MSGGRLTKPAEGSRARRVLVVDDVPLFRELESLFLSRYAKVSTAASAEEALEIARADPPDIALLDFHIPDLGAERLCRALRKTPGCEHTAILFITSGEPTEHARAVHAGAADVLAKPLSRMALVASIQRFLSDPEHPRGLPRVDLSLPVLLRGAEGQRGGTVKNLSRGGMFIEAGWLPPADEEFSLEFSLPEVGRRLSSTAALVWRRLEPSSGTPGIGVRFLGLDGRSARELEAFVYERALPEPVAERPGGAFA